MIGKTIPFNAIDILNHPQFGRVYTKDENGDLGVGYTQIDQGSRGKWLMVKGGIMVIDGPLESFTGSEHPVYDECFDLANDTEQYRESRITEGGFGRWLSETMLRHTGLESLGASNDIWPLPNFDYGAFFQYREGGTLRIYLTRFRLGFERAARGLNPAYHDFRHSLLHEDQLAGQPGSGDDPQLGSARVEG